MAVGTLIGLIWLLKVFNLDHPWGFKGQWRQSKLKDYQSDLLIPQKGFIEASKAENITLAALISIS